MKKVILAGLAAFMLGTAALSSPAEARCWWNGYSWHCWRAYHPYHSAWWWRHHHPYRYYGWGYGPYWRGYWYP